MEVDNIVIVFVFFFCIEQYFLSVSSRTFSRFGSMAIFRQAVQIQFCSVFNLRRLKKTEIALSPHSKEVLGSNLSVVCSLSVCSLHVPPVCTCVGFLQALWFLLKDIQMRLTG